MNRFARLNGQIVNTQTGRTVCCVVVCKCEDESAKLCPMHGQKLDKQGLQEFQEFYNTISPTKN